jgi:hypothetical protein
MRDVLTHQRGELRTKKLRLRFGSKDAFPDHLIRLREGDVIEVLDDLAESANRRFGSPTIR